MVMSGSLLWTVGTEPVYVEQKQILLADCARMVVCSVLLLIVHVV